MRIWPIIVKELKQLVRDPRSLVMNVAMPLLIMVMFGVGYGRSGGALPIAVANLDQGEIGWEFVQELSSVEGVEVAYYVTTEEEALELVRRGQAYGAVVIPRSFTSDIKAGRDAYVKVIVDAANPFTPSIVCLLYTSPSPRDRG